MNVYNPHNLTELRELDLPGPVFIYLREDIHQLLLTRPRQGELIKPLIESTVGPINSNYAVDSDLDLLNT